MNYIGMIDHLKDIKVPNFEYNIYKIMHPLSDGLIITNANMIEMREVLNKYTEMLDNVDTDYRGIHLEKMLIKEGFECLDSGKMNYWVKGLSKTYPLLGSSGQLSFNHPLRQRLNRFKYKLRSKWIDFKYSKVI